MWWCCASQTTGLTKRGPERFLWDGPPTSLFQQLHGMQLLMSWPPCSTVTYSTTRAPFHHFSPFQHNHPITTSRSTTLTIFTTRRFAAGATISSTYCTSCIKTFRRPLLSRTGIGSIFPPCLFRSFSYAPFVNQGSERVAIRLRMAFETP